MLIKEEIQAYNNGLNPSEKETCDLLEAIIDSELPHAENKIWHGHPVSQIEGIHDGNAKMSIFLL